MTRVVGISQAPLPQAPAVPDGGAGQRSPDPVVRNYT